MSKGERKQERKMRIMETGGATIARGVYVLPSRTKGEIIQWYCH